MKRAIALLLTIGLVFAAALSSAEIIPATRGEIENLPDMPVTPEMTTKNDGTTCTVTLSAPLESLEVIADWGKINIPVAFDESGLVGSYSLESFKHGQPGVAGWIRADDAFTFVTEFSAEEAKEIGLEPGTQWWAFDLDNYADSPRGGSYGNLYTQVTDQENEDGSFTQIWTDFYREIGWSDMDYAYIGRMNDGKTTVKYNRKGVLTGVTAVAEGANFFADEPAPAKTEVTWAAVITDFGRRMYISSITVTAADGTSYRVDYASGGKKLRVKENGSVNVE